MSLQDRGNHDSLQFAFIYFFVSFYVLFKKTVVRLRLSPPQFEIQSFPSVRSENSVYLYLTPTWRDKRQIHVFLKGMCMKVNRKALILNLAWRLHFLRRYTSHHTNIHNLFITRWGSHFSPKLGQLLRVWELLTLRDKR